LRASKLGISKASIAREKERKKQRRGASDSLNQIFNKKKRKEKKNRLCSWNSSNKPIALLQTSSQTTTPSTLATRHPCQHTISLNQLWQFDFFNNSNKPANRQPAQQIRFWKRGEEGVVLEVFLVILLFYKVLVVFLVALFFLLIWFKKKKKGVKKVMKKWSDNENNKENWRQRKEVPKGSKRKSFGTSLTLAPRRQG